MDNVHSLTEFKNGREINSLMAWFGQFNTSPDFNDMMREVFKSIAFAWGGDFVLPFTIKVPTVQSGYSLDLSWWSGGEVVLTTGWMRRCNFAAAGAFMAMTSRDTSSDELEMKFVRRFAHETFIEGGIYPGFGSGASASALATGMIFEMAKRSSEICEYRCESGDRHYSIFFGDDEDPQIFTFTIRGVVFQELQTRMHNLRKTQMPKAGPSWENVRGGKIRAKIVSSKKPESPLFKKGKDKQLNKWIDEILIEEIVGDDREAMEEYVQHLLAWHWHYATYYNIEGWSYEVTWKG